MKISQALSALCLLTTLGQSALAGETKVTFGAIDRATGGRDYTMLLSSIQADKISIRSTSSLPDGSVKVRKMIYSDGVEAIAITTEPFYTSRAYKTIYTAGNLDSFESVAVPENCKGPCLVISAEGFAANDNNLEVVFESKSEDIFMTALYGLSAISFPPTVVIDGNDQGDQGDQDNPDHDSDDQHDTDPVIIDRTGTDTQYRTNAFTMDLKKYQPNADGSVTASNFLISRGNKVLPIYPVPAAREKICELVMNSPAAYVIDWNVRKNGGKPSFYVNADDSVTETSADYVLKSVTCSL